MKRTATTSQPGKVVPLVHVNAISFVCHNFIKEGLVFWAAFIGPLWRGKKMVALESALLAQDVYPYREFDSSSSTFLHSAYNKCTLYVIDIQQRGQQADR